MVKPVMMIYDDERRAKQRYRKEVLKVKELSKEYEIEPMEDEDFSKMVRELRERVQHSRKRKISDDDWNSSWDTAAIFIIDYDLAETLDIAESGEQIAYYLRCFSKCDYILGLNQFGIHRFDLTLTGHLGSYSDLNVGANDLSNPGLWTGKAKGYRPWYWPSVIDCRKSFNSRFEDVRKHFSEPICEVLGFPERTFLYLPQSANQHLGSDQENITKTTFKDFFEDSSMVLREKDRRKGRFSDDVKARIVAARLSKWMERTIMSGQSILVDAPHLAYRFPSLLKNPPSRLSSWNATTCLGGQEKPAMKLNKIRRFEFKKKHWVSRPVWFWGEVSESGNITEVREPWKKKRFDVVFAEDASRFFRRKDCSEFVSDVDSPFRRRFIKYFDEVDYRPRVRLLME